jgi:hypothetical protein
MMTLLRRWAFLGLAFIPATAFAGPPTDPQFDFNVAQGVGAGVKANANVSADLDRIQTTLGFAVEADPGVATATAPTPSAAASSETVNLSAAWAATAGARLELSLANRLGQSWETLPLSVSTNHQVNTDERTARVALALAPFKSIDVNLSGVAAQKSTLDTFISEPVAPGSQSRISTTTQSAGADVRWRPVGFFSISASGKLESTSAFWRGAAVDGGATTASELSYVYFQPSVTGALTTPGQGKLGLTFEQAVSPIDLGAFSTFAAVEDRPPDARFGPNREERYRLNFDQKLAGDIQLSAALVRAHIESATELGPVGFGLQAPVSVPGGQRQEVDVSLSTPLTILGLPSVTLKGAGSWRQSQVRDPFTGDLRRTSGETPQLGTIGFTQTLPGARASWGLEGRFGGDQSFYQMSQVTNVTVADSVGGFVDYDLGAFALRLQVDGLYGGDRSYTDLYYAGTRSSGAVDRTDRRTDSGRAIQLTLHKAL